MVWARFTDADPAIGFTGEMGPRSGSGKTFPQLRGTPLCISNSPAQIR